MGNARPSTNADQNPRNEDALRGVCAAFVDGPLPSGQDEQARTQAKYDEVTGHAEGGAPGGR